MNQYKNTLLLPHTALSMKGNLPTLDVKILEYWKNIDLNQLIWDKNRDQTPFIVHQGPPFATGILHTGHLLNLLLKDLIIRSQHLLGKNIYTKMGWDCHGLPIETKVIEQMKKNKESTYNPEEFREKCRVFAETHLQYQKTEMEMLGFIGDFKKYYTTMDRSAQLSITDGLLKLLEKDCIYRGKRIVIWSLSEKTTLAEAEIEYKDHKSKSIYFLGRIKDCPKNPTLNDVFFVVWTTTSWTLPGNLAYGFNKNITYTIVTMGIFKFIIKKKDWKEFCEVLGNKMTHGDFDRNYVNEDISGDVFEGARAMHPLYDKDVPMIHGDFVTEDKGTGIVHLAPAHGEEDYNLCKKNNINPVDYVDNDGFYDNAPFLPKVHIYDSYDKICELLNDRFLFMEEILHRYPYSSRGKTPIIYKLSEQWFISLDKSGMRQDSLKALESVNFYSGKDRLKKMIENRMDWCISRQRTWGIPIPFFYHKKTQEVLINMEVNKKILHFIKTEGYNFWYKKDPIHLLPVELQEDYTFSHEIVDVWFESGMTHDYVLGDQQADVYLEGSDQSRGWFQSSLLISAFLKKQSPYKQLITHGFIIDNNKNKMSKSIGNVVFLKDFVKKYGNDVLRLWVINSDFYGDVQINESILENCGNEYRKIRNTLKFIMGVLNGYDHNTFDINQEDLKRNFCSRERWLLYVTSKLNNDLKDLATNLDIRGMYKKLFDFCNKDLSQFYLDIIKPILYNYPKNDPVRMSILYCLSIVKKVLLRSLAVIIPCTSEEVFLLSQKEQKNFYNDIKSVHLLPILDIDFCYYESEFNEVNNHRKLLFLLSPVIEDQRNKSIITINPSVKLTIITDYDINIPLFREITKINHIILNNSSSDRLYLKDGIESSSIKFVVESVDSEICMRCRQWFIIPKNPLCKVCKDVINTFI